MNYRAYGPENISVKSRVKWGFYRCVLPTYHQQLLLRPGRRWGPLTCEVYHHGSSARPPSSRCGSTGATGNELHPEQRWGGYPCLSWQREANPENDTWKVIQKKMHWTLSLTSGICTRYDILSFMKQFDAHF